jgi:S-adenosylmethionine:tRNA ribosyltransferase-isomerase
MRLDEFDYHLPKKLIAQQPLDDRSASRLMVVDRGTGAMTHSIFVDLTDRFRSGDVLVLNRSRVIPARLFVRRSTGGRVELFVTRILEDGTVRALANPMRRLRVGDELVGGGGDFACLILERLSDRELRVQFESSLDAVNLLESFGHIPLPPYITRPDEPQDRDRYQTVYGEENGSVAAPTAGLHFTDELLGELRGAGVVVTSLVLHVGLGTFLPLDHDVVERNTLHGEFFSIDGNALATIAAAKSEGRRVTAVGTTVTRVLETVVRRGLLDDVDPAIEYSGETDLFIHPGFEFKCVDRMITNFHLPKSSLLLLVSAFLGVEKTLACYRSAVENDYRFYSYGDAMFVG